MAARGCPVPGIALIGDGPPDARYTGMIVGESPGSYEHLVGRPFIGAAGSFLRLRLQCLLGADQKKVFLTNAIKECPSCRNQESSPKASEWAEHVRKGQDSLKREIARHRPAAILALGRVALYAVTDNIDHLERKHPMGQLVARSHVTSENLTPAGLEPIHVIAAYHPSYISTQPRRYPDWKACILRWRAEI